MRILWLSHILPYPPKGGGLQRSHHLLKQTAKRHEVHLVSLYQKKILATPEALQEAVRVMENLCERVEVFPVASDGSKWRWSLMAARNYLSSLPYDINWLRNEEISSVLGSWPSRDRFDLIHVDTIGMIPYALPFSGTPVVLNHHNVESHMMERRSEKEPHPVKRHYIRNEAKKLKRAERRYCPSCAVNLVVSELDGARLKEAAGDLTVSVVPNGVDTEYFRPRNADGGSMSGLVFAGGMDWYPNRDAVLFFLSEIWPMLRKSNPETSATIIGREPPKELVEAARQPSLAAPGFVDDVRPYIEAAKIYICPILDGGGTRLKVLDALAMEKALVATGLAVEGLGLVEEKHYLRAENAPDFVRQIVRLENDGDLCREIARSGRRFVEERYSWDIIGKMLEDAYQEAASRPSPCMSPK